MRAPFAVGAVFVVGHLPVGPALFLESPRFRPMLGTTFAVHTAHGLGGGPDRPGSAALDTRRTGASDVSIDDRYGPPSPFTG